MNAGALFAEARHLQMLRHLQLIRVVDRAELRKRIVMVVIVGWLPLALIALYRVAFAGAGFAGGFFPDVAVHARLLLTVPLLIASEYVVLPRLESIGKHFETSSLIAPSQHPLFVEIATRARALSAGVWPSLLLLSIVYAQIALLFWLAPRTMVPAWQTGPYHGLSIAGLWHMFVSLPILLGLTLAWLWRLLVWGGFLWRMSRLGLCVLASHPDRAGGLQFLAFSPRIFAPLAFALASVVAGTMADRLLQYGQSPIGHEMTPAITVVVLVLVFASPPLLFSRVLLAAWRAGVFLYGDLAMRVGNTFEQKWLHQAGQADDTALDAPDFSAMVDLYGVVANVYDMRLLLLEYRGLATLAAASLLPFLPVWMAAVPIATLMHRFLGMLF